MQDRYRLRRASEFRRVYSTRRRHDGTLLTLYLRPNQLAHPRIGFAVSGKVGGAVVRNAVKRRLREASRAWLETQQGHGFDLVVVARPEAAAAGFGALAEDLAKLLSAAGQSPAPPPPEDADGVLR
jgi:ribonuclease P protein component